MVMPPKNTTMNFKLEDALHTAFANAVKREADMLGLESHGSAAKLRELMRDFVSRVEQVAASAEAQHAAKVLSKGKGKQVRS